MIKSVNKRDLLKIDNLYYPNRFKINNDYIEPCVEFRVSMKNCIKNVAANVYFLSILLKKVISKKKIAEMRPD